MSLRYIRLGLYGLCLGLVSLIFVKFYLNHFQISHVEDKKNLTEIQIGGPFNLIDQHGKNRIHTDFYGKIQMIYFGYGFCPDVCPLGLQNMTKALEKMGKDIDQIAPIFITIDPVRDTIEFLKTYAQNWHSSFSFLTGTQTNVNQAIKNYKVYAQKAKPDGTYADYLMDHSTLIYIMDRKGNFIESLSHTTDPQKISNALKRILIEEIKK